MSTATRVKAFDTGEAFDCERCTARVPATIMLGTADPERGLALCTSHFLSLKADRAAQIRQQRAQS